MKRLLRGGHVITMDDTATEFPSGDVLIDSGRVVRVGVDIQDDQSEVIDCRGTFVLPGFIDTHVHGWESPVETLASQLWSKEYHRVVMPLAQQFTAEMTLDAACWTVHRHLDRGITTVVDHSHVIHSRAHLDAALAGAEDAGGRYILGLPLTPTHPGSMSRGERLTVARALLNSRAGNGTPAVAIAVDKFELEDLALAAEFDATVTIHANPPGLITQAWEAGLLNDRQGWVHANAATPDELQELAGASATVILSPDIEVGMGKSVEIFGGVHLHEIPLAVAIDSPSYTSSDLLAQVRLTQQILRFLHGENERRWGRTPSFRTRRLATGHDLLSAITRHPAKLLGCSGRLGVIQPGSAADLVVLRNPGAPVIGSGADAIVLQSTALPIDRVFVSGHEVRGPNTSASIDIERMLRHRMSLLGPDPDAHLARTLQAIAQSSPMDAASIPPGSGTAAAGGLPR